jgi:hypothetical protein
MVTTNKTLGTGTWHFVWTQIRTSPANFACAVAYSSTTENMTTVRNSVVTTNKFNVDEICTYM